MLGTLGTMLSTRALRASWCREITNCKGWKRIVGVGMGDGIAEIGGVAGDAGGSPRDMGTDDGPVKGTEELDCGRDGNSGGGKVQAVGCTARSTVLPSSSGCQISTVSYRERGDDVYTPSIYRQAPPRLEETVPSR
jgi:hypothetical protein